MLKSVTDILVIFLAIVALHEFVFYLFCNKILLLMLYQCDTDHLQPLEYTIYLLLNTKMELKKKQCKFVISEDTI